jgi:hypothetical protein
LKLPHFNVARSATLEWGTLARLDGSVEIEDCFVLLAMVLENPFLGVVIGVEHGQDHGAHVAGVSAGEIRSVDKIERDRLAVR